MAPPRFILHFTLLSVLGLLLSCQSSDEASASPRECYKLDPGWKKDQKVDDVLYDLYVPPHSGEKVCQRLLLVLPGWKFPRQDWIRKSPLESMANREQMILVMPEMNLSIYESQYYPETTMKWNSVPGGAFLKERFFPEMQRRHGILRKGYPNFMIGLSTGGRGVVMVHLQNPGLFLAGAALSGDFDQSLQPGDNLMRNVYGAYPSFRERWHGVDNPVAVIESSKGADWTMPLYLAHGQADRVVPLIHSEKLYSTIRQWKGADFPVVYRSVPGAGHDYRFWGGQLESAFQFFGNPAALRNEKQ